jgi:uncharacterized OB-fold protein
MEPSRFWRNKDKYLKLQGEKCPHCEVKIFPPRDVCPDCGDLTIPFQTDLGKGVVTDQIHVESTFEAETPEHPAQLKTTTHAVVRLGNGTEVPTIILTGSERIPSGSLVHVVGISDRNPREISHYFAK